MVKIEAKLPLYDHDSRSDLNPPRYTYGETWFQAYKMLGFHRVRYLQRVSRDDL